MPPGRPAHQLPHESIVIHRPAFRARLHPSGGAGLVTPLAALRPLSVLPDHKLFSAFLTPAVPQDTGVSGHLNRVVEPSSDEVKSGMCVRLFCRKV
jgi:hypothetical protein